MIYWIKKKTDAAFITNTAGKIGVVTNDFYYIKSLEFVDEELVPVKYDLAEYSSRQTDSIQKEMSVFADAYFQTARYLLMNNKQ